MKIYDVRLEHSSLRQADEEEAIITEYKEHRISVTELCEKLAQYGLQVVRLNDDCVRLQTDVTDGRTKAIVSFEVEL